MAFAGLQPDQMELRGQGDLESELGAGFRLIDDGALDLCVAVKDDAALTSALPRASASFVGRHFERVSGCDH